MCIQHARAAMWMYTRGSLCLRTCVYAYCTSVRQRAGGADRFCIILLKLRGCKCDGSSFSSILLSGKQIVQSAGWLGAGAGKLPSLASHDALVQLQYEERGRNADMIRCLIASLCPNRTDGLFLLSLYFVSSSHCTCCTLS